MSYVDASLLADVSRFLSTGKKILHGVAAIYRGGAAGGKGALLAGTVGAVALGIRCVLTKRQQKELDEVLAMEKESFSEMLLRKIREKGMDNAECYTRAHINRRVFSKIIGPSDYRAGKKTVCALILALELPYEEAEKMLMKAGFAFSDEQVSDRIIKYCICRGIYDIFTVNEILRAYGQQTLGEKPYERDMQRNDREADS